MKKHIIKLLAIAARIAVSFSVRAQTNTVPNFLQSLESYVTVLNTNFTFTNDTVDIETGYKQVTGANAASFATLDYYFAKSFEAQADIQFSGVGSAVNAGEIGIGYAVFNKYDTRITADVLAGYDDIKASAEIEPKLELKKKLTTNTFASVGISLPVFFKGGFNSQPTFWTGLGVTF